MPGSETYSTVVDTLVADSTLIATYQADATYDYNRELVMPDYNLMSWIGNRVGEWLSEFFGGLWGGYYTGAVLIAISIGTLLLIGWLVYKKRPELFGRSHTYGLPYEVQEDTIYGVDFAAAIAEAVARTDWHAAVRLLYLQMLRQLSDAGRIEWQLYKTPTQYVREVRLPAFRLLTDHFLRVRYGNFEATEALFRAMQALQAEVEKGGER